MTTTIELHPHAKLFPMMTDAELHALAVSISRDGLDHPITLDQHGRLIDGKCRLAACEGAGVVPQFETRHFEDDDAVLKFVWSMNAVRQHRNLGQQAMALVLAGKDVEEDHPDLPIAKAREVLAWSRDRAELVLRGLPLHYEWQAAREAKASAEAAARKLTELRAQAQTLADLVAQELLTLEQAWLLYQQERGVESAPQPPPKPPPKPPTVPKQARRK
jgi:hypothetical protein